MNKILLFILINLSLKIPAQVKLSVFINHEFWNGDNKVTIRPNDTIELKLINIENKQIRFTDVKIEIVLRKNAESEKERKRRIFYNQQSQSDRLKYGLVLSPIDDYLSSSTNLNDFSNNPVLKIVCNRFVNDQPLSRIIIHIRSLEENRNNIISPINRFNLGYARSLIRDGISFWRGIGFE